jgi:hypothetical protein
MVFITSGNGESPLDLVPENALIQQSLNPALQPMTLANLGESTALASLALKYKFSRLRSSTDFRGYGGKRIFTTEAQCGTAATQSFSCSNGAARPDALSPTRIQVRNNSQFDGLQSIGRHKGRISEGTGFAVGGL